MKTSHLLPFSALAISVSALGTGPGPYDDLDPFIAANNRPNATGAVYLSAVNMSTLPSTLQPELWRASINITEVAGAKSAPSGQVITNSVISLDPMGNLIEGNNSNTDWTTCAVIITSVSLNATVKGQDDTGDCTKTFGEECVTAWNRAVGLARATAHGSGACGGMNLPRIPDACRGSFDVNALSQDITNASSIDSGWLYQDSVPHDASNKTYYESAATRIWPLMILQTAKNSWNGSYATNAKLSCLRATNATSGSEKIGDVPGAASVVAISKALIAAVGLLGAVSLLGLWNEVSA